MCMLVVQAGIERLSTKKIKQVEEVATFNQDCKHTKVQETLLAITKNIHYVATCNWLGQRGKKMGCLRNGFRVSC